MAKNNDKIRVAELFAGVGGFRIGLEGLKRGSSGFSVVWSNQWEPGTKKQHASEVYIKRFGSEGHSNDDIAKVTTENIPEHDLLVGGFPCQDYSVARTLSQAAGLSGKKGVLWWQIHRILKEKGPKAPKYLMLENVDRLLKSPSAQRGRDFAVMLASLSDLGYIVEWRVINAAEYGLPQRRRRIYILGYKNNSQIHKTIKKGNDPVQWLSKTGTISEAFPIEVSSSVLSFNITGDLEEITESFNKNKKMSPFLNAGIMIDRMVHTTKGSPSYNGPFTTLADIIIEEKDVPEEYFISRKDLSEWKDHKGAKNEQRETKGGFKYTYTEGSMIFPDALNKPSRTIVTGEGGSTPSRFKHVIRTKSGKLRRLTPLELERLNMFPDNHTEGASDTRRAFFMGNALVVGVIAGLGKALINRIAMKHTSPKKTVSLS